MTASDTFRLTVYVVSFVFCSAKLAKALRLFALSLSENSSSVGINNELAEAVSNYQLEIQLALSQRSYYNLISLFYLKKALHFRCTDAISMLEYGAYAIYCIALSFSKQVFYVLLLCQCAPGTVFRIIPSAFTFLASIVIPLFNLDVSYFIPFLVNTWAPAPVDSFSSENAALLSDSSITVPSYTRKRYIIISGVLVLCIFCYFFRRHFGGEGLGSNSSFNSSPGTTQVAISSPSTSQAGNSSSIITPEFLNPPAMPGMPISPLELESLIERNLVPIQPLQRRGLPLPYRTKPAEARMVNGQVIWVFPN